MTQRIFLDLPADPSPGDIVRTRMEGVFPYVQLHSDISESKPKDILWPSRKVTDEEHIRVLKNMKLTVNVSFKNGIVKTTGKLSPNLDKK